MIKKILYYIIQTFFLIDNLALMYCLRSAIDIDIMKDIYPIISILIIVLVLFFAFGFGFKNLFVSLVTLLVCAYLSSQSNYYLQNKTYYSFSFEMMFKYTDKVPIIAVIVIFVVTVLACIFIKKKYDIEYTYNPSRLLILGVVVLAALPIYLFRYEMNRSLAHQKYDISEQPYYNYYYLDDVKQVADDYGLLNYLCRDIEVQKETAKDNSASIKEINKYFSKKKATTNEYTGLFKDKNIIIIESIALDLDKINEMNTPTINEIVKNGVSTNYFINPLFYNKKGDIDFMANTSIVPYGQDKNTIYSVDRNTFKTTLSKGFVGNDYFTQYFIGDYQIYENVGNLAMNAYGYDEFYDCTSLGGDSGMSNEDLCDKVAGMLSYFSSVDQKYMALVNTYSNDNIGQLEEGIKEIYDTIYNCGQKDNYVIVLMSSYNEDIKPIFTIYDCAEEKTLKADITNKPITSLDLLPTLFNLFGFDNKYAFGSDILDNNNPGFAFELDNDANGVWYNSYAGYLNKFRMFSGTIDNRKVDEEKELKYFTDKAEMIRISHLVLDTDYFGAR